MIDLGCDIGATILLRIERWDPPVDVCFQIRQAKWLPCSCAIQGDSSVRVEQPINGFPMWYRDTAFHLFPSVWPLQPCSSAIRCFVQCTPPHYKPPEGVIPLKIFWLDVKVILPKSALQSEIKPLPSVLLGTSRSGDSKYASKGSNEMAHRVRSHRGY